MEGTYGIFFMAAVSLDFQNINVKFLAHLSRRLKWAIVIAHCPSIRRPSGVNFSYFRLLLQNHLMDFDET